jgi:riboflavin kinase/FMN adenylyltransferase
MDALFLADVAVTIGNFDGVHLGHEHLLNILKNKGKQTALLTFSNHPITLLKPHIPYKPLFSIEHNIKLLEPFIDHLIIVPFTQAFADQDYVAFVKKLKKHLQFSYLVLGKGSVLGKDRMGTQERIELLAKSLDFQVEYVQKISIDGQIVSTSNIKKALEQNHLEEACKMLGYNYSSSSSSG